MRARSQGLRAGERGYSLIELLVVLGVIGVLALAMPALISADRPGIAARTAAQSLGDVLRRARLLAARENREVELLVDLRSKTVSIDNGTPIGLEGDIELLCGAQCADDAQRLAIAFYPDGSTTGGTISVITTSHRYLVGAQPLSGRVFIHAQP